VTPEVTLEDSVKPILTGDGCIPSCRVCRRLLRDKERHNPSLRADQERINLDALVSG
jgi:hypothetical protein